MLQDKKTVIRELIEMGKAKGKLTTKEINDSSAERRGTRPISLRYTFTGASMLMPSA